MEGSPGFTEEAPAENKINKHLGASSNYEPPRRYALDPTASNLSDLFETGSRVISNIPLLHHVSAAQSEIKGNNEVAEWLQPANMSP
ncbi:hypothetical protein JYU34_009770 [Plutella xylostella]|uniref:Uncharacterized protein n=1 Tax=Plutella xylostella TaxID=51655 RepID=A0ABQ7QKA1_PLUXY|nr:hypothetical protein JYU34_009770 [Plutella xylostella]